MVQFIWHLIRCTSTSEKHKLALQMKQLLNLKANEIKDNEMKHWLYYTRDISDAVILVLNTETTV